MASCDCILISILSVIGILIGVSTNFRKKGRKEFQGSKKPEMFGGGEGLERQDSM